MAGVKEQVIEATLYRFAHFPDATGTFSRLVVAGFTCFCVEREWAGNQPFASCIPEGRYFARRITGSSKTRGRETFELIDVPGRANIQIHPANWASQLNGCIAPGTAPRCIDGRFGVPDSSVTFDRLMAMLVGIDAIEINITRYAPEYP